MCFSFITTHFALLCAFVTCHSHKHGGTQRSTVLGTKRNAIDVLGRFWHHSQIKHKRSIASVGSTLSHCNNTFIEDHNSMQIEFAKKYSRYHIPVSRLSVSVSPVNIPRNMSGLISAKYHDVKKNPLTHGIKLTH